MSTGIVFILENKIIEPTDLDFQVMNTKNKIIW